MSQQITLNDVKLGIQVGDNLKFSSNKLSSTYTYTLPVATASTLGGVKPVSVISTPTANTVTTTAGKYYQVSIDSSGKLYVNVPWENTEYTVNDAILTIQKNGTSVGTFTANQAENKTINITVPTSSDWSDIVTASGDDYVTATANDNAVTISASDSTIASLEKADSAVQSITTGTSNGTILVDGTSVSVKGLGSAAYTSSDSYATSAQGSLADSAVQSVSLATGTSNGQVALIVDGTTTQVSVKGLGSAAYTSSTAYATAAQGTLASNAMPKSGGTFTGAVTLASDPTSDLQPTTKQYVDTAIADVVASGVVVDDALSSTSTNPVQNKVINTALEDLDSSKQDTLTTTQLAAVNSGITSTKVTTYDGYASKISTNASDIDSLESSKADASTTYTKTEVDNLISNLKTATMQVVSSLPTEGEEGVIYLLGTSSPYEMYTWENSAYISLGSTEVDLTNYVKNTDIATSSVGGVVKPVAKTSAMTQSVGVDSNGLLYTTPASESTVYGAGSGLNLSSGNEFSVNTSYTTSGKNYKVQVDSTSGGLYVNVPWSSGTTYSIATASTAGLVKPVSVISTPTANSISTTSGRYYQISMDSTGKMYVNVPWENDTYTLPTASTSTLGGVKIGDNINISNGVISVADSVTITSATFSEA